LCQEGRRKKEEGRRKREEGRGKKEEGRRKKGKRGKWVNNYRLPMTEKGVGNHWCQLKPKSARDLSKSLIAKVL
jgi:hypothetical protein